MIPHAMNPCPQRTPRPRARTRARGTHAIFDRRCRRFVSSASLRAVITRTMRFSVTSGEIAEEGTMFVSRGASTGATFCFAFVQPIVVRPAAPPAHNTAGLPAFTEWISSRR